MAKTVYCSLILALSPVSVRAQASPPADFAAQAASVEEEVRALRGPGSIRLSSYQERDTLLDLLRDGDPGVRRSAVRSLKNFIGQTYEVRDRVLALFRDEREDMPVRLEAAKTLSLATNHSEVRERLQDYARRGSDPALRALSYKALYSAAASLSHARSILVEAAKRESERSVRMGALWGLFLSGANYDARDALLETARRDSDPGLRVEALKSLYGAMGHSEVRDRVYDLARDTHEGVPVRYASILLLSAVVNSSNRDLLADLARREREPALREAAVMAMNPGVERIVRLRGDCAPTRP